MREIDLDQPVTKIPRNTFLSYGDFRSGKTTFAATFPRPLFLADATESGWDSIKNMDRSMLFEPEVTPKVWAIESMGDMALALTKAEPLIASGEVMSIAVDSLTFYVDLYLNFLIALQAKKDTRAAYGDLGVHLRDLRVKMHSKLTNVIWLALAKHPDGAENPGGGPMIPGQQADKFAAGCDFIMYHRRVQEKKGGQTFTSFEARTQPYGAYPAGNRLGVNAIGDPFLGTYTDLLLDLGYDVEAIKKSLPPIKPKAAVTVAVKPAPAIITPPARKIITPAAR